MKKHTLNKYLVLKRLNKKYFINYLNKFKINKLFFILFKNHLLNYFSKNKNQLKSVFGAFGYFRIDIVEKPIVFRRKTKYCRYFLIRQFFRSFYGSLKIKYLKKIAKISFYRKNAPVHFLRLLESRLDVFLYRLGLVRSVNMARQLILHSTVSVNFRITKNFAYNLGVKDVVSFKFNQLKSYKFKTYSNYVNNVVLVKTLSNYIEADYARFVFKMGVFKAVNEVYFPFRVTKGHLISIMNYYGKELF